SRRRHTRSKRDWSSDVCSSDLLGKGHDFFGFVAGLFVPPLHKIARIGLVGQDRTDGGNRPKTGGPAFMTGNKVQSLLLFVAGRRSEERRVGEEGGGGWRRWRQA